MMDKNKVGMLAFIGSEAVFFACLIIAYMYYRVVANTGTAASHALDPITTGLYSICLIGSSGTLFLGERSLRRGAHSGLRLWLIITIVLGLIFLYGQGTEWLRLIHQNVTISQDLFGTTFFTLTGFHGLHVLIGLLVLTTLLGFALTGHFRGTHSTAVETISLYWHFVDAVWIVIFAIVYLWTFV